MMAYVVTSVLFKIACAAELSSTLLQLPILDLEQILYMARVLFFKCRLISKLKKPKTNNKKSGCISPGLVDMHVYNLYACI